MNNPSLDPLLEAYSRKAFPSAPGNLEQNVWRKIRLRAQAAPNAVWQGFLDWILDRRFVGVSLLAAVVVGFSFNLLPVHVSARQAMGLDVFSRSGYSPLAELAQNR
jgi:hypothetical protein